jgi:acetyltransferase
MIGIDTFFSPKSVAVIGASSNPEKLGYAVVKNLIDGGYSSKGTVYPINPSAAEILGLKTYPSVLDVPNPIDLAVIVIPYAHVPDALRTCGQKGIPSAIVISAGFREAGQEGLERELELVQISHEYHLRLIGPNCLGVHSAERHFCCRDAPIWTHGIYVTIGCLGDRGTGYCHGW